MVMGSMPTQVLDRFFCILLSFAFLRKQNKESIDFATLCDVLKISSPGNRYMALPPPTKLRTTKHMAAHN